GKAHVTPVARCRALSEMAGCDLAFKCENLQRVGAFKFRGAFYMLSTLAEAERARGVITYSSGNHAQAVALAASFFKTRAVIVMPEDASGVKLAATRGYGAEILQHGFTPQERQVFATHLADERRRTMVPPYEDLRSLEPGAIPFPIVKEIVRGILRVNEDDIRRAMLLLLTRAKVVAEPSGAVTVAGALVHAARFRHRRVAAIISGGNVEPATLAE